MNNRVLSTEMTATLRRLVQTTIFLLVSLHQLIIELGHWDWSVAFQASSITHAHGSRDSYTRSSDSLLFLSCMSAALCSGAMRRALSHVATVSVAAMCSGAMKRALSLTLRLSRYPLNPMQDLRQLVVTTERMP